MWRWHVKRTLRSSAERWVRLHPLRSQIQRLCIFAQAHVWRSLKERYPFGLFILNCGALDHRRPKKLLWLLQGSLPASGHDIVGLRPMVTAVCGDPAMGGEGTTPFCCGFEILQNCWGTRQSQRNRRVQPEVKICGVLPAECAVSWNVHPL